MILGKNVLYLPISPKEKVKKIPKRCGRCRRKIKFNTGCWAWKLTVQKNGGSIATIANTGLGTHAMDDADNNKVNDYLEVYDGWLELKFFELYSQNDIGILGELHQGAITNYLNMFLGNNDEMDIKMVQQWQLFGDPVLELCGS